MYVCVCNAVTDRRIRQAVDEGIVTMHELTEELGVASCCGSCEPLAREILNQRLAERAASASSEYSRAAS
jgi:bacterioferritin-associated ferredoxin